MTHNKKIILFFPKILPYAIGEAERWNMLPMSLLALASPLETAGFQVEIIDQRVEDDWKEMFKKSINNSNVLMVGISVMTGYPIKGALDCSRFIRSLNKDITIVWGGVHPTLMTEQTLSSELVDIVVTGEGEESIVELANALGSGSGLDEINGINFKKDGKIICNTPSEPIDLETSQAPAYHLVDIDSYLSTPWKSESKRPLAFFTSRGCSWRCGYCYNLTFNRRRWRSMR